jgi:glycosyltransferase involved in cell wall biosynthesis
MSSNPPAVSVVIPAHNAGAYLPDCLASVHSQSCDAGVEIIVVDDGSVDASVAIARSTPGVTCLSQPRRGPSAARNAGIAAARGEYIAFLDADDLWPPGKLDIQLRMLRQQPATALVFGDCRQFDASGAWPRTEFEAGRQGAAAWGPSGLVPDAYPRLLAENFITTGSVIVRHAALAEVGGFSDDLHLVEDLDLWLRIARRRPIAWCGEVCLLRRRHDANTSRDPEAMSLAFLEVLRRQPAGEPSLAQLVGDVHVQLAELALGRGRYGLAAKRAWRALAADPHPRTLLGLLRATVRTGPLGQRIEGIRGAR